MFLKKILLPIFIGSFSIVFSQEKINSINYEMENFKGISTISDEEDKKIILMFNDKLKIDFIQLDDTFQEKGKISLNKESKEKSSYLGYSKTDQNYLTYWENQKEDEILVKTVNFNDKTTAISKINFALTDEIIFNSCTINNVFYILSIVKKTNTFNIYTFKEGNLQKKTIDCSNLRFINADSKPINFWGLYSEKNGMFYRDGFRNINNKTNGSLVLNAQKKKIYTEGNSLILSFDNNPTFNQNLIINLNDYSVSQKVLQQENVILKGDFSHAESNSFLLNNKMFLIKTSAEQIYVTIKDLDNNLLKKITYTSTEMSDHINSDIIQENGNITNKRILEKPNQFVRKVHDNNPAITGVYENGKYILTIGGASFPQQDNLAVMGGMFGIAGAIVGALIHYSTYTQSIDSYSNKKVIYLKCILDENFNHLNEKSTDTNFDKLRAFIEEDKTHEYPSVFGVGKKIIYCGYNNENKTYDFYQF